MAVHIEVPGDFGQGELNAVELPSENDLTSQPGVLLKHGRHVEHVVLPENRDVGQRLASSHIRRHQWPLTSHQVLAACQDEQRSRRRGTWSRPETPRRLLKATTEMVHNHFSSFSLAAEALTFQANSMFVSQKQNVVSHFGLNWDPLSGAIYKHHVDPEKTNHLKLTSYLFVCKCHAHLKEFRKEVPQGATLHSITKVKY